MSAVKKAHTRVKKTRVTGNELRPVRICGWYSVLRACSSSYHVRCPRIQSFCFILEPLYPPRPALVGYCARSAAHSDGRAVAASRSASSCLMSTCSRKSDDSAATAARSCSVIGPALGGTCTPRDRHARSPQACMHGYGVGRPLPGAGRGGAARRGAARGGPARGGAGRRCGAPWVAQTRGRTPPLHPVRQGPRAWAACRRRAGVGASLPCTCAGICGMSRASRSPRARAG